MAALKRTLGKAMCLSAIMPTPCRVKDCQSLKLKEIQSNLNSSNPDGSSSMANSNSFFSPYEILPINDETCLRKFSYFIMELYVVCTH